MAFGDEGEAWEGRTGTLGKEVLFSVGEAGSRLGAHVGSANRMCLTRDDAGGVSEMGSAVNRRAAALSTRGSPRSLTRPAIPPSHSVAGGAGPSNPLAPGQSGAGVGQERGSWGGIAPYGMVFGGQTVIYPSDGGPPRLGPRRMPELGFTPPAPVQLTGERFVRPVPRATPPGTPVQRVAGQGPAPSRVSMPRHSESGFPCFGYPPITTVRGARSQSAALPTAQAEQNPVATERNRGSQQQGSRGPVPLNSIPAGLTGSHRMPVARSRGLGLASPVLPCCPSEGQTPEFLEPDLTRPRTASSLRADQLFSPSR